MSRCRFLPLLFLAAQAGAQNPALPTIPANTFYITNYGAVADGVTTNTAAVQNAINAANSAGGGTVRVTAGNFLCGPFNFVNNLNLQLDSGATLTMLPFDKFPGGDVSPANFIQGSSLHDVEISGPGLIEGQGLPWWKDTETNSAAVRPNMVNFSTCTRVLIQDITCSNSPSPFLVVKGRAGNVTIQRVKVYAPSSGASPNPSHNTDAIDLAETNAVIRDCIISTGDDNLAVGSSASASSDILVTNCTMGYGHGVSIGSFTSGGVSNMTVINCTFTNTDQGIRIKSDRDRGGIVQNINYYNLSMGNVQYPILIYCSYTNTLSPFNSLNSITPSIAAAYPSNAVTTKTPIYRNITISNLVASAQSGRMAGLVWGLPEMSITNFTLNKVALAGSKTFGLYYTDGVKLIDSQITVPAGVIPISFFNADITFTNSATSNAVVVLDGVATNSIGNNLAFYNAAASLKQTNALDFSPVIKLRASTFTISNHLNLAASSQLDFILGTNAATMVVRSNLALGATINVSAGNGFTNGSYTLFTYGNGLVWNSPALAGAPAGYLYSFDTNTAGQVKLLVTLPVPSTPTNLLATPSNSIVRLSWSPSANATTYHLKRSNTNGGPYAVIASGSNATNFNDTIVTNTVTYYYVVSALNSGGESTNSAQANATPAPSLAPVTLSTVVGDGQLTLSWPGDHTGWRLLLQTNALAAGLGTNWTPVANSQYSNQFVLPIDPATDCVFLRLTYP